MKRKNWTESEIAAVAALYFRMRRAVTTGETINKASMIRGVIAGGLNRSRGSVEAKMMNISAVLRDIGRAELSMEQHGYKCAPNYQGLLRAVVSDVVNGKAGRALFKQSATTAQREAEARQ